MQSNRDIASATVAMTAAILLLGAGDGLAQSSSGVTGHAPRDAGTKEPQAGPGRSRLPLVDPKVVPPGGTDSSQKQSPGTPGSTTEAPGQTGETTRR